MNVLITICGRAGSKGVEGKNLKEFLGYPLILYTLSVAKLFSDKRTDLMIDISVNSDSQELLDIASKVNDIHLIMRPANLAGDTAPKLYVIKHSLNTMESRFSKQYDYILDLDITSPLRTVEDVNNVFNKSVSSNYDVVFSVVPSRRNPYFNMIEIKDGIVKKVIDSHYINRQQAPKIYDMNASIYCYRRNSLINILDKSPFTDNCGHYEMIETGILDIDGPEDFELMKVLAEHFFNTNAGMKLIYENIKNLLKS